MDYTTNLMVCEVEFWDEVNKISRQEFCLCNASTYGECTEELETFYGVNNIVSMKMTALEAGPVIISEDLADLFIKGEGLYVD